MEDFTRPWIEGCEVANKIDFRIGDANIEAPKLGITFDMVFVDGDKRTYLETYETVLKMLRSGGIFLPIIRCGTDTLPIKLTNTTTKHKVFASSTTL